MDPLRARGMRCEELFGEDLCSLAMCAVRSASCPAFGVSSRDGRLECRIIPGEDGILGAVVRLNVRDRAFRRAMRDLAFQRRLTGLVEQDPGTLMLVLDGDGRVLRANGAAGDLFRGSPVGRYAWEMGSPHQAATLREAISKGDGTVHLTCPTRDRVRHLVVRIRSMGSGDGARTLVLWGHDVTELIQARDEADVFRSALDQFSQSVCITNPLGAITYVNRAFEEMYGYTQQEALGKNPRILNPGLQVYLDHGISQEDYRRRFQGMWDMVLDPSVGRWEGEVINRRKDGSLVWVQLIVSAIRGRDGDLKAIMGIPVDLTAQRERAEQLLLEAYRAIVLIGEMRDEETGEHLIRIGSYCRILGEAMGLSDRVCRDLEIFSQFHDIGKVGIPDSILLAPRKLDPHEFELMKRHTIMGYQILKGKGSLAMGAEIALNHHERWDGSGYPQGLEGERIPLSARITAVADVYDALRSRRPYKEPIEHREVVDYILRGSGSQFDPRVVEAFNAVHLEMAEVFRLTQSIPVERG